MWVFQEAFSGSCPWSEPMESGPGTQTEHQGSEHALPQSMGISLIWFYHLHLFGTLTFPSSLNSECGILLSWVSALWAGAFCVLLYPMGLVVSTSMCVQGPILSCLCNLCIKTHSCSFTWRLHSIFWSLTVKWKGKSKVQRCEYAGNWRYVVSS